MQLQNQFNEKHDFRTIDVSDEKSVTNWAEEILTRYGPPDMLINNASIVNRNAPIWAISNEEFFKVMSINVNGAVNVMRSFVPAMIKDERGIIINNSSSWARTGEAELAPYCASKFAIEGLTQSMAAVALNPVGSINTSMLHSCGPQYIERSQTPEECHTSRCHKS